MMYKYRMIKKSLCTWWLYCNHQVHRDFLITVYIQIKRYLRILTNRGLIIMSMSTAPLMGALLHMKPPSARNFCLLSHTAQLILQRRVSNCWPAALKRLAWHTRSSSNINNFSSKTSLQFFQFKLTACHSLLLCVIYCMILEFYVMVGNCILETHEPMISHFKGL
jgi:uncharacterized membrane protein YagU involved in acid resistance